MPSIIESITEVPVAEKIDPELLEEDTVVATGVATLLDCIVYVQAALSPREQDAVLAELGAFATEVGGRLIDQHRPRTGQVLGQAHDPLAVLVGQDLADRRLRPRLLPLDAGGDGAQADQAQDLRLDVEGGEPLAHHRIGDRTAAAG